MPANRSPGPDGYTLEFFRAAWGVVCEQMIGVVQKFFVTGKLLRDINATLFTLVPKCQQPNMVTDIRLISCCNTIYKRVA